MKRGHGALDDFIGACLRSGKYRVDGTGAIFNTDFMGRGCERRVASHPTKFGYQHCWLRCLEYGRANVLVHRVVALAFHGAQADPELDIDHVDGDKGNNAPGNLQWVCRGENMRRAYRGGLRVWSGPIGDAGENNPNAKLSDSDVREIHRRIAAGGMQKRIAAEFGVSKASISMIKSGANWAAIYREFHP